jgi:cytochrome c nitrite reductase small subunit
MTKTLWVTLVAAVALGMAIGIGVYTFVYAKGASYLTDNPEACVNCHVMRPQYFGWSASSHRNVAGCNDCHTPSGFAAKYYVKAKNGFWHSFYFTTDRFHEPIRITESNRQVTEKSCRKCHQDIVQMIDHHPGEEEGISCVRCHGSVGHPVER